MVILRPLLSTNDVTMTTVVANSGASTRGNHHILSLSSRLPFPTSPSLPDRRTRSDGENTSLVNGDGARLDRSLDITSMENNNAETRDQRSSRQFQIMAVMGTENGPNNKKENSVTSSCKNNKVRRSHRNIVTSRKRTEQGAISSLISQSSLSLTSDKNSRGMEKVVDDMQQQQDIRSPDGCINTADPPPLPGGVFLTSLVFEDSPRHTESTQSPSSGHKDARSSSHVPAEPEGSASLHPLGQSSRTVATRNTVGLQRVYLEGLDYMRAHISNVEKGADIINRRFHKADTSFPDDWLPYLRECNNHLLQANSSLLRSGVPLQVIDTETKLVALLNNLREDPQPDMVLVEFLTKFWEEIRAATQELQVLLDKFGCTVLHRISSNYTNSQISQLQAPVCQTYTSDIEHFSQDLQQQLTNAHLLLKNYGYSMNSDIIDRSGFQDRLMVCCDLKAFPILGFVSDIAGKITRMCDTARQWLARDEQFMHEINDFIRETRTAARKREEILHLEKTKQKKVERNAKAAHNMMLSNRQKLCLIEAELRELERRLDVCREEQQARMVEIHQKESMIDFLQVTMQQTKKHCRLQTKRVKLHKQVKELGDYVRVMEADLEVVQDQILAKSHEKIILTEKINTSEKSYGVLRTDLDKFSDNLEDLEAGVSDLSGQLLQLEIVHTIRTSPEILDNLTDRPTSVKLSNSLRQKIKQKHRKYLTLN